MFSNKKGVFVTPKVRPSQNSKKFESQIVNNIPFLNQIAAKYVNNNEDKEDLIQETVYKALKNRKTFRANSNIKGWLTIVLKHTFINQYHKNKNYKNSIDIEIDNLIFENLGKPIFQRKPDNLNRVNKTFVKDIYWEALNQLPGEYKLVILMSDVDGFSYDQISEFLNCSVGTIRSRLYRSRKSMVKNYRRLTLNDKY